MAKTELDSPAPVGYNKNVLTDKDKNRALRQILTQKNLRLKIAESFTGGYLSFLFTAHDGASKYLVESIICYNPQSKIKRLGVNPCTINKFGTVSCACVKQMLKGLIGNKDCDIAIATSGNASDSLEATSTRGVCYIGLAYKNQIYIYKYSLGGTRMQIIKKGANLAIKHALEVLKCDII